MDLAAQLEPAVASGRWFRLEPVARMQTMSDFGVVEGTSQPLFLAPDVIEQATELLEGLAAQGRLIVEHEITCPRCRRCCWQYPTLAEAKERKIGYLVDCPHCADEWPCVSAACHPVYRQSDGYCPPLGHRSRLSALASREVAAC